jgi:predicted metal-dependent enzyme (double-stranded beta helix superfamily)
MPAMLDLDRFMADCREALAERSPQLAVRELMARAVSDPAAVEAALGAPRRAGLGVLYRSAELTVLNVVWTPGLSLYPHNHQMWTAIGLYAGREENRFFRREGGGLAPAGAMRLDPGSANAFGPEVIHAVHNPLGSFTGALHVYGGDFFATPRSEWDPDTLAERPFEVERARRLFDDANERWLAQSR